MPRPAKIWRRSQGGSYYASIGGQQVRLSEDYAEAVKLFHFLKKDAPPKPAQRVNSSLEDVCNKFLEHGQLTKAARTYKNQQYYLQALCDKFGKTTRVRTLTGSRIEQWLLEKGWGQSTRAAANATIRACFNWSVKEKLLIESPMWGTKRGTYKSRQRIIKAEEKAKIAAVAKGGLKDLLFFLEMTGCRPFSEAAVVTASMIDWQECSITFAKHKTEHQGKTRVIYLPPALLERLRELAEQYPTGPLLRTQRGKGWTNVTGCRAMRRLERRAKVARLNLMAWRHTYITDCLAKGMSPTIIAKLVGNSARTIAKYYDHVEQRKDALREAARQAVG
jgi:integrase